MSYSEDVKKTLDLFARQGKAYLDINLVRFANDSNFDSEPPSCSINITVLDPKTQEVIQESTADISTTSPPYNERFEIKVETVVKSFKRFLGKPEHRPLHINVLVTPINGYQELYESDCSIEGLVVEPGNIIKKNVALKPVKHKRKKEFLIK